MHTNLECGDLSPLLLGGCIYNAKSYAGHSADNLRLFYPADDFFVLFVVTD